MRLLRGRSTPVMRAMWSPYPCRCFCRGFEHSTRTTPWRRITLHFLQMGLTDARTFMSSHLCFRPRSRPAQDIRAAGSDGNGVLEVGRQPSVAGRRRPAILLHVHLRTSRVDHGLDRQHQALGEPDPAGPGPVIRHLGVLVELAADAVPDELTHQAEARALRDVLDGAGDVRDGGSWPDV